MTEEKKILFDKTSLESMQAAKRLAEEQIRALGGTVDNVEEIKRERDELHEKLQLVAQKAFEEKKQQLGAPEDITTPEELKGFEAAIKNNKPKQSPSGQAPLNTAQMNIVDKGLTFASHEELVQHLQDLASSAPKPEQRKAAQNALNQLWLKSLKGQRETQRPFATVDTPKDVNVAEMLNERYRRRKKLREDLERGS